ncbi:MAG: TIGR02099 family protein [Chromatiaceae bacterium]|jgi:uncharacterized protein (TIGR02099 family)|nr:TIGR02099 family protein [Chromatiaceae bacterium]
MVRFVKSAAARALSLALVALVGSAALLGVVRLAVPFADHLRAPVEALLAQTLGMDAEVGGLGMRLVGWAPRLSLRDARLIDPASGRTQLSLRELRLDLDAAASLRAWAPKVASLTLVGANLVVRRHADGHFSVAGLEGLAGGDAGALTFFLGNGRFLLTESDVYLIDEGAGVPAVHLADVAMRFDNTGLSHRIGIRGRLFGDRETQVRLAADLDGPAGEPARWRGPVYLQWQGRDLGPVLGGRLPPGLHLGSAMAAVEAWGELRDGALADALARVELRGLVAWREDPDGTAAPMHLQRLSGLVQWTRLDDGWRVDVAGLQATRRGATSPATTASLRLSEGAHADRAFSGGLSHLDLGLARDLLALLPGRPPLPAALRAGRLEGTAEGIDGQYRSGEDPSWSVQGRLAGLALDPVGPMPGVRGLSGTFRAGEGGGTFDLDAAGLSVTFPALLRTAIDVEHASGRIDWERSADGGLRLRAEDLAVASADLRTRSRIDLSLPGAARGEPFLDLQTDFADVRANAVSRYLPVGLLKPELVRWLDGAFPAGAVPRGTLILRGVPADFPFRDAEGRFLVDFSVVDGTLDFRPGWPRIEDIEAEVRFEGPRLVVEAASARFLESELQGVRAEIPDLMDQQTRAVAIAGRAKGPFADGLRVLRETPLAGRLGPLTTPFAASGRSRLDLGLVIPLRKAPADTGVELHGVLSWPEPAALALPNWGIELNDLGGELRFSEHGLSAESVTARLWDAPVVIRIASESGERQPARQTRVRVEGRHATAVLAEHLPSSLWGPVRGMIDWSLEIGVRAVAHAGERPPLDLVLGSDLRGVAVELPAPLGKTAGAARPLRLTGRLDGAGALGVTGSYGDLGFALGFATQAEGAPRLTGAGLNFGGKAATGTPGEGLRVTGRLDSLDLSAWLNWWDGRPPAAKPSDALPLRSVDARIGRLMVSDLALQDLSLRLARESGGWRAQIDARELAGTVRLPDRPRSDPIEIRLARLDLKGVLGEPGGAGAARERRGSATDPRRAPTLDLGVERLLWGEELIGALTLALESSPEGVVLTGLALDGPLLVVRGRGAWTAEGSRQRSELKLTTEATDMGAFLRLIEFKSQLDEAPANATFELSWPGGPADFSLAALRGRATAEVGAGSLLDVEPGVGRMLGILNLAALQRRLTLDFRDLFDRGFAFEQISGALSAEGGKARIERLAIEGPSASISVEGETDLLAHRFDQVVTVTPRLGSSLAVASAVAAGPLVGAAVYLADKVTGGVVDRIGRHQYEVSGPWEDPEIRRRASSAEVTPNAELTPSATPSSPPLSPSGGASSPPSDPPAARSPPPSDTGPFFDSR